MFKVPLEERTKSIAASVRDEAYDQYLRARATDGVLEREINGHTMYLDVTDAGISRDLIRSGRNESITSRAYAEALDSLAGDVPGEVAVLEVGANIGYNALTAFSALGDRARVYAVEPEPSNLELFERTMAANGYADRVEVDRCAFGSTDGTAEMYLSSQSNWHTFEPAKVEFKPDEYDGTLEVPIRTGESFLASKGLAPEDVHVVRMDVEAYEGEVLRGMESVFEAPGPLLANVELHPHLLDRETNDYIVDLFDSNGFELVSAAQNDDVVDIDSFEELHDCRWVEIVARK